MSTSDSRKHMTKAELARLEGEAEKWPSDAEEEATRELVALGDELNLTGVQVLETFLSVEAVLMRHNLNPRKLRDAMNYLSKWGNE